MTGSKWKLLSGSTDVVVLNAFEVKFTGITPAINS